jgi:hypothetical protein
MDQRPTPKGETPRAEPEIIPPGQPASRVRRTGPQDWSGYGQDGGVHRVYVAKAGPFGFVLLGLVLAAVAAFVVVLVVGAFLIVIPLAGLLLAAAVISGFWRRGPFRRAP